MSKLQHRATPGKKSDSKNLFISTKVESLVDKVYVLESRLSRDVLDPRAAS